jgi:hypothetical protein
MSFKSASLTNPRLQHPDEVMRSPWNNHNQEVYQYLQFNNIQLPEIAKWEAGEEYEIVLKVKMEQLIDSSNNQMVGDFKVLEVKTGERPLTSGQKRVKEIMV